MKIYNIIRKYVSWPKQDYSVNIWIIIATKWKIQSKYRIRTYAKLYIGILQQLKLNTYMSILIMQRI